MSGAFTVVDEFALIRRYFAAHQTRRRDVAIGIGDDAAVLRPPRHGMLVMTADLLLAGVHFPAATSARNIGYKALAVNLSDLAAMGAEPAWALLSLSVPEPDADWFEDFSRGLFELADAHGVQLVGGDLVRGQLVVGVQLTGFADRPLTRSGAGPDDDVYVTGELGGAATAMAAIKGEISLDATQMGQVMARLDRPEPRVAVGAELAPVATAAIDISDGLHADLGHLAAASGVGARIDLETIPLCRAHRERFSQLGWHTALGFGDDYELCFTAPAAGRSRIARIAECTGVPISRIGFITTGSGLEFRHDGRAVEVGLAGYDHFA